ncbi:hypothetical protein M9458_003026, partial [Cirrhinus mrigala]
PTKHGSKTPPDAVENFSQQFSATQKQTEAVKHILPWRAVAAGGSTSACSSLRAASCVRPYSPATSAAALS